MRSPLIPLAVLALLAAPLALSACGTDSADVGSTTERGATGTGLTPETKTCPEESPSFDWNGEIVNRLPVAVQLTIGDYTCNDWSGASTPGAVLNGKVLQPAKGALEPGLKFGLEPRRNTTRIWTTQFEPAGGGDPYGTARVYLEKSLIEPFMTTPDQGTYERTWTFQGDTIKGWFLRLGPIDAPDTPTSLLPQSASVMGIVVHNGHVAIVTDTRVTG